MPKSTNYNKEGGSRTLSLPPSLLYTLVMPNNDIPNPTLSTVCHAHVGTGGSDV